MLHMNSEHERASHEHWSLGSYDRDIERILLCLQYDWAAKCRTKRNERKEEKKMREKRKDLNEMHLVQIRIIYTFNQSNTNTSSFGL